MDHERLTKLLGWSCYTPYCDAPTTRVRYWPNPVWGVDENFAPLTEAQFLADLATLLEDGTAVGFTFDQIRAYCLPHFDASLPQTSGATLGQPDDSTGPSENTVKRTQKNRTRVIELLGQKCSRCTRDRQAKSLEVRLRPEVPQDYWAQQGLRSWAEKYEFLTSDLEFAQTLVELVCRFCVGSSVSAPTAGKQNLRQRVVDGYGGYCSSCGKPVDASVVWVVRKSGVPAFKWGESGRKLTSKQKLERLVSMGFPDSHQLVCPECR